LNEQIFITRKVDGKEGSEKLVILLNASNLLSTAKRMYFISVIGDKNDGNTVWVIEIWDSKTDHR